MNRDFQSGLHPNANRFPDVFPDLAPIIGAVAAAVAVAAGKLIIRKLNTRGKSTSHTLMMMVMMMMTQ